MVSKTLDRILLILQLLTFATSIFIPLAPASFNERLALLIIRSACNIDKVDPIASKKTVEASTKKSAGLLYCLFVDSFHLCL